MEQVEGPPQESKGLLAHNETMPPRASITGHPGGPLFVRSSDPVVSVVRMTKEQHIAALCAEHGIRRTVQRGRGRARVKVRWIQHPPLRDEMAYFVALHEIGHICVGLTGTRLTRETAAWEWALQNSLVRPSYPTRQRICACLVRYMARAIQRGWRIPPPESHYWDLLAWWSVS